MDEAVPDNSTNSPFELLQAPNAVVIEATEASKQRYRGLTAGPLMNGTWDINPLPCVVVQARQDTLQLERHIGRVLAPFRTVNFLPSEQGAVPAISSPATRHG